MEDGNTHEIQSSERNGGVNRDGTIGTVAKGNIDFDGRVIVYIVKGHSHPEGSSKLIADGFVDDVADQTSYINYIKPLILVEELQIPYVVSIVDTSEEWYSEVHPERYVPALKDKDPQIGRTVNVFESTACLQYLADRFDSSGSWQGRTPSERAVILSWTAYQTAGLG